MSTFNQIGRKGDKFMNVKTLNQLKPGERATIVKVGGEGPVRRRILDMGVVTGADIEVVRVAPLGDPVEFRVKGYNLSLRKSEAQNVQVEAR
jgi:ferrous iron transport protein A